MDQAKLAPAYWKDMVKGHGWKEHGWEKMGIEEELRAMAKKVGHPQAPPPITAVIFSRQRVIMEHAQDEAGHHYLRFPRFNHNLQDIRFSKNRLADDGIHFFKYEEFQTGAGHLIIINVGDDDLPRVKDFLGSGGEPFLIGDVRERLNHNRGEIATSARTIIQEHRLFGIS